ncbi:hypothetical protein [Nitrosomonas supralitoralis]
MDAAKNNALWKRVP